MTVTEIHNAYGFTRVSDSDTFADATCQRTRVQAINAKSDDDEAQARGKGTRTGKEINSLPALVYYNAIHNPSHLFCLQSAFRKQLPQADFTEVTFLELAYAVERCCAWLLANVEGIHPAEVCGAGAETGTGGDVEIRKCKPVALFLESDPGLFCYIVALLALNVPCVLLSIRLSPQAIVHLLQQTEATTVLVSNRTNANVKKAFSGDQQVLSTSPNLLIAPIFDEFLNSPHSKLSWTHSCDRLVREDDRNVIILHSSGSTGLPKPISLAHRYLLGYATCHEFPESSDESTKGINFSTLPLFHGFGVLAPSLALSVGKAFCLPPSTTIVSGKLLIDLLQQNYFTSLMTVPTILEDVTLLDDFTGLPSNVLAALDFVAVGGGGMNPAVAEKVHSNGINLLNHFGATELGALAPIFRPTDNYDYRYLKIRKDLGLKLEKLEGDDFEPGSCKLIGYPFGWNSDFELQDRLLSNPRNPTSEVKILGRNDDLIVLSTGEKVLPYIVERELELSPQIRRAIVFGNGQAEVGVIVEPTSSIASEEEFIDSIWESVLRANSLMDAHGQISSKSVIIIKAAEKSIPLSDKGQPQRKAVYELFGGEIQLVYESLGSQTEGLEVELDIDNSEVGLRALVRSCLPPHSKDADWADDEDFINLGMDSLQATRLRRALGASLRKMQHAVFCKKDLPADFIYSHPSISQLSKALTDQANGQHTELNRGEIMNALALKYTSAVASAVVLITGTTGNLGSHAVQALGDNPAVKSVICFIRAETLESREPRALEKRQKNAWTARNIELSETASAKVKYLPWSPGKDLLGLSQDEFWQLAGEITHVFHGAWPMDFKMKVTSFEPQINSVQSLVDLCSLAHRLRPTIIPKFLLASSIAVAGHYELDKLSTVVPEAPMVDPNSTLPIGYAEAKWVCEKLFEGIQNACDIQPVIVRIGQLAGSQATGYWAVTEHFPALVRYSQNIGAIPDLQGTLSWLPVDIAAMVVSDILLAVGTQYPILHLENPVRQPFVDVMATIARKIGFQFKPRLPFPEWLERVKASEGQTSSLMEFYENHFIRMSSGSMALDTTFCRKVSPTLDASAAVSEQFVGKCVDFWTKAGLLESSP
ncbi:hypothetical protein BJ878DRAFT_574050 [Calycina marina]|uniref:Polyketide synthase-like phosphopantetheine-binding domain-containing protein n=1 Tax=Calycina marina TaxID=1763456 RepID=A0A9P7Z779_9HELO|nr:hypothetical protein BJ878DRAFT_574050 [Calycina marina]